jgi:two-component system nitrate/nitrite response regulator NarL
MAASCDMSRPARVRVSASTCHWQSEGKVGEAMTEAIRLLIVDDHVMFREGLARSLEKQPDFRVVGQFSSSTEAVAALASSAATMVLLDVDLGSERALDFLTAARRGGFDGLILIVTAGISDPEAVNLIQAGISGILHKHHSTEVLCDTIREVASGKVWLEEKYLGPLFRSVDRSRPATGPKLDERDRKVLRHILQGLTNREIATRLDVTEGAIKAALHQLFNKLGVRTRAQLVKVVLEQYRDQL